MSGKTGGTRERLTQDIGVLWRASKDRTKRGTPFDVLIVGTGYGGSAAAQALAGHLRGDGKPATVCVLERGQEYLPGDFPSRFADLPAHLRVAHQNSGEVGQRHEGLFDLRLGDDVVALVANGVGGGSLINAGVMLQPDPENFEDGVLRSLLTELDRDRAYDRAIVAVGGEVEDVGGFVNNDISRHPRWATSGPLKKTAALHSLTTDSALKLTLPPITVAMDDRANVAGITLTPCNLCGDCMTGCNVGAKNSLDVTLLAQAKAAGAEIYTGATVLSLSRSRLRKNQAHWLVRVVHTDPKLQANETGPLMLRAKHVILAAGTLGSPEILLRSRTDTLSFSSRLGEGFSCNGDNIAAVHRLPEETGSRADEEKPLDGRDIGPTITGSIEVPRNGRLRSDFLVQEFSVPGPMRRLFDEVVTTAHMLNELSTPDLSRHGEEPPGTRDPLAVDPDRMARSLLIGIIGHDDAGGSLHLSQPAASVMALPQSGALRIRWPEARRSRRLDAAHARLQTLVPQAGKDASLISNPMWRLLPPALEDLVSQPRGPVLTVHPLGGCRIADSAAEGVVDRRGRVFDTRPLAKDAWEGTLLVLDGSIIPGSLGVNPALTITAVAMNAAQHALTDWGLKVPVAGPAPAAKGAAPAPSMRLHAAPLRPAGSPTAAQPTEVEIVERLWGDVPLQVEGQAPRPYVVELTLAYKPVEIRSLMSTLDRQLEVESCDGKSLLRIFDKEDWDGQHLAILSDRERASFALVEARLGGRLAFFHREPSRPWQRRLRALRAWLCNRGKRDTWQQMTEPRAERSRRTRSPNMRSRVRDLWTLASRAGEVRRFDYELSVEEVLRLRPGKGQDEVFIDICVHAVITGAKRLTYERRANPWRQLTQLRLTGMPFLQHGCEPILELDPRFLVAEALPLMRITKQENQANAWAELASFGLYFARVLVSTHLWTFRKPDRPRSDPPKRLPGPIAGFDKPEYIDLPVDHVRGSAKPLTIRLTRYRPMSDKGLAPLVMIHGYSVSGNTFTHESLKPSAAAHFLERGREVWIVDLRTSTGLDSATLPWAMEDPALIDIPAALLHIRNVSGRRVDVFAHCIGCVMLSMALLTDARKVRDSRTRLGVNSWLSAEQMGILTAFNGPEPSGQPHPCIRRIILSQKGPVLKYTDRNIFQAFVMQSLRRWLLSDVYQFRPADPPTVSDQLADRLLTSLPYPARDYDVENPTLPWSRTPWTTTRHRMDVLYGRDFNAENMSDATLRAIDDLFGPMHLETVSQVIPFTRFNAITNQSGRGEFVTRDQLYKRWSGISTFAIHGQDNGLVDVETQHLLRQHLRASGVPLRSRIYQGMGHQDVLIGRRSREVFKDVEDFLNEADEPGSAGAAAPSDQLVVGMPWIGPVIDALESGNRLTIACMSRPDQGQSTLLLLPASGPDATSDAAYTIHGDPAQVIVGGVGSSDEWLFVTPALDPVDGSLPAGSVTGWFALLFYPLRETTARVGPGDPAAKQGTAGNPGGAIRKLVRTLPDVPQRGGFAHLANVPSSDGVSLDDLSPALRDAPVIRRSTKLRDPRNVTDTPPDTEEMKNAIAVARDWLAHAHRRDADACFVRLDDLRRTRPVPPEEQARRGWSFTLASCQYPAGLIDEPVATASLAALQTHLDDIGLALFVGDQIYADATAGLVDPTRSDERYDQPNEKALRVKPLRHIMRRVPTMMLLDDHEIADNWAPQSTVSDAAEGRRESKNQRIAREGLAAFWKYQRRRRLPGRGTHSRGLRRSRGLKHADVAFIAGGYPFYLADTRTGRAHRSAATDPAKAHILGPRQRKNLEDWLRTHRHEVKFVATPSTLFPRRRTIADDASNSLRCDAWDGFPGSLQWLVDFIVDNDIRHTVFLSGDEHHSLVCELRLSGPSGAPPIKVVCIHASALHAPFPFANGAPRDFADDEDYALGQVEVVDIRTQFVRQGDGFARIDIVPGNDGAAARLVVHFIKAQGRPGDVIPVSFD